MMIKIPPAMTSMMSPPNTPAAIIGIISATGGGDGGDGDVGGGDGDGRLEVGGVLTKLVERVRKPVCEKNLHDNFLMASPKLIIYTTTDILTMHTTFPALYTRYTLLSTVHVPT